MRPGVAPRYDTLSDPAAGRRLRSAFRTLNRAMVLLWRLGLGPLFGRWPSSAGTIFVLGHRGRRSGRMYRTPLNYARVLGEVYCIAGFGASSDWYRNVDAARSTEVWLPDGRWEAELVDISDDPHRLDLIRRVMTASGFAAPLFGLYPRRMTESELAEATAGYRLLHVRRLRRLPGGPADLAWLWALPAAGLLLWPLGRCRARARRRE